MDAEPERPVVRVVRESRTTADQERAVRDTWSARRDYADWAEANSAGLQLLVHHVHAHVEVLGDVPLCPRTDPPGLPIGITANIGRSGGCERGAGAQEVSRLAAVRHCCITAVQ